jgi:hypothetical protein
VKGDETGAQCAGKLVTGRVNWLQRPTCFPSPPYSGARLMAENSGKMDIVTFDGPEMQNAVIKTIKYGLESTPGVTATLGTAWIVEGKLNYMDDPKLKDKGPGAFKMYSVALPNP